MKPISIVQGLQGQFVFCSPAQGGCGSPTPVLIPIASTADISAILIGIQLSSGGNVVASSLNVSGNSTMGGTLGVTGAVTMSNTLTVSGATATGPLTVTGNTGITGNATISGTLNAGATTVGALTAGATTMPQLTLTQAQPTLEFSNVGGHLAAAGSGLELSIGAHFNGTAWVADQTSAALITESTSGQTFFLDSGLTVGSTYTPTATLTANTNFLFERDQNAATYIQVENNNAGAAAVADVRAFNGVSGGNHVIDMAMPSTGYTTNGFFAGDRGYVASNGANGLLVEATGAGGGASLYLAAPNSNMVIIPGNNHFLMTSDGVSHPTIGACGTGPVMSTASVDNAGALQTGSTNSCQVVFAAAVTGAICLCGLQNANQTTCTVTASGSGFTAAFGTTIPAGSWMQWICIFDR
jgi:hypothetical protein